MFSLATSPRLPPPRPATPATPIFSFSFGDWPLASTRPGTTQKPAPASAVILRKRRRLPCRFIPSPLLVEERLLMQERSGLLSYLWLLLSLRAQLVEVDGLESELEGRGFRLQTVVVVLRVDEQGVGDQGVDFLPCPALVVEIRGCIAG